MRASCGAKRHRLHVRRERFHISQRLRRYHCTFRSILRLSRIAFRGPVHLFHLMLQILGILPLLHAPLRVWDATPLQEALRRDRHAEGEPRRVEENVTFHLHGSRDLMVSSQKDTSKSSYLDLLTADKCKHFRHWRRAPD